MTVATSCTVHRWLLTYPPDLRPGDPPGKCMDCGEPMPAEKADNRAANDRREQIAKARQNSLGKRASEHVGVTFCQQSQMWVASMPVGPIQHPEVRGRYRYIGQYATQEEAVEARKRAMKNGG